MLQKKNVERLRFHLQRLFALKVGRTTFRELQNAILASVEGSREEASKVFEAIMRGEVPDGLADKESTPQLRTLIDTYCVPCRLAQDIYERGEFVQVITSDTLRQNDRTLFVNRVRRIDGDEIQFLSDVESTLHLIQHFAGRLADIEAETGDKKSLEGFSKEFGAIKRIFDQLQTKVGAAK